MMLSPFSLLGGDELLAALANCAGSITAREALSNLAECASQAEATRLLDETTAMTALQEERPDFAIPALSDLLPLLDTSRKGATLTGAEIHSFAPLLRVGEKVRLLLSYQKIGATHPLASDIEIPTGLAALIEESIHPDGQVSEEATPTITRLSDSVRGLKRSIAAKAESLLREKEIAPLLQEEYVTLRDNRFVLPILAEHKNHIEGIIHDSSNTGQTFYIEPKALVDMNNRLRTAEIELNREIEKLLAELTGIIAAEAVIIEALFHEVIRLDIIVARATFAHRLGATRPTFGPTLSLRMAANPLMLLEETPVVRNDITMPQEAKALIISGPNTGGKTVTLKTIGMLAAMAKRGLFITADAGSTIPFYRSIQADIGDSQSIHDGLSTFSAHIRRINEVIHSSVEGSLALLDELMVSTDPQEGSALAVATLNWLTERGVNVIVTTHFHELKILAQSQNRFENCSMEFDTHKGVPTYRLIPGSPGQSSALTIAAQLAMKPEIIAAAHTHLDGGDLRLDKALEALNEQKSAVALDRRETILMRAEAEALRSQAETIRTELFETRDELKRTAKRKVRADLDEARKELNRLIEEARWAGKDRKLLKQKQVELEIFAQESQRAAAPREVISRQNLSTGDRVFLVQLDREGRLESVSADGKAEVSLGNMRVSVNLADIVGVGEGPSSTPSRLTLEAPQPSEIVSDTVVEIHLRGMRVAEALDQLEAFLDNAAVAGGGTVRIIHGRGTGALRTAVREYLAISPYVSDFHSVEQRSGGEGVTLAILK